ncbi:MAG: hypothetical protein FJ098_05545 [Deltaproteobacteria bacterium]|nr:hypothetical protein [Deltaproteobacteria bacterium]
MSKKNTAKLMAEELQRILEEFGSLEEEINLLSEERKRLAALAHGLLRLLQGTVRLKTADKLLSDMGLQEIIARLPGVPGRKPSPLKTRRTRGRKPAGEARTRPEAETPTVLPKGSVIRMLAGIYQGWIGVIRWVSIKGSKVTYAVSLTGPEGQIARTEVTPRSFGKKWERSDAPAPRKRKKKPGRKKAKAKKQPGRKPGRKPAGGKAGRKPGPKPGRKPARKPGPKPGRKPGPKPGRKPGPKPAAPVEVPPAPVNP